MEISLNMSRQRKPQPFSESTSEPLSFGKKKDVSKRSKLLQDNVDTISSHTQLVLDLFGLQLSTPESAPVPNNQISTDKLLLLSPSTQNQKLFQKSEEDSTSRGKSFKPYWNESCKRLSDVLWWRTKIDSPDSDLTTFDGCVSS